MQCESDVVVHAACDVPMNDVVHVNCCRVILMYAYWCMNVESHGALMMVWL